MTAVRLDATTKKPLKSDVDDPNVIISIAGGQDAGLFRVVDSWNMPLEYIRRANDEKNFPLIRSAGPDRIFGTEDDIVNRKN